MAQFYGTIKGNRGCASRLGTKKSGLRTTCNGWEIGVSACIRYDEQTDRDIISVSLTHGSNGGGSCLRLGSYVIEQGEFRTWFSADTLPLPLYPIKED